jgi:hypothetical protein
MQPFVPHTDSVQLMSVDAMPGPDELKSIFKSYFINQNITDQLIKAFIDFNSWAKDKKNAPYTGKNLSIFIKKLAILTEQAPGKVFSTIKYLVANDTLNLPIDYLVVLNWRNAQKLN